jgi:putative ABC transport system permease protein
MISFEIVKVAMGAVRANLLRSVLTTLGIVIGIAAVITMVALGEGAQRRVQEEINRMGSSVLTIRPGQQFSFGVSRGDAEMSIEDAMALREGTGGLLKVTPEQRNGMQVSYLRWNVRSEIMGVWPEYFDIYDHQLLAGRFFTQSEVGGRQRVAVLGFDVPTTLGETPPDFLIGETFLFIGIGFDVI